MQRREPFQKVLFVDAHSGFYRLGQYPVREFFGPVDLGLHLSAHYDSLNIGTGLLAGSLLPGSNRLFVTGISPCWKGFYISSMGGAGLVFDTLGINVLALVGKADVPSVLLLNRSHGEQIEVALYPLDLPHIWSSGRGGTYAVLDTVCERYAARYDDAYRILATGPAAQTTDCGGIASVPVSKGTLTSVDTWAGRGGFGSRMLQHHGIAAIIYGGTSLERDFLDRSVVDEWFVQRYQKKLAAKDFESTVKYRFDPVVDTGGTFGVNYATLDDRLLAFNYRTIYPPADERRQLHQQLIVQHYLRQFNEETIKPRQQATCGEPCAAVCKKMHGSFKKDYEPYQALGPLCGVFDQRAAESLVHHADMLGFDAIAAGGVVAWLLDCLDEGVLEPPELGVAGRPRFTPERFDLLPDSQHNAALGCALLDAMAQPDGAIDLSAGARHCARQLARNRGRRVLDLLVCSAYGRRGWMVPNQYWTPGVLAPMPIMGKYYMHYGDTFMPPRQLGREHARRMLQELMLDNLGLCRFHRSWAEEMLPDMVERLSGMRDRYLAKIALTASRITSRNNSLFWEGQRSIDFVHTFLRRRQAVDAPDAELDQWVAGFAADTREAALEFWYQMHKGVHESLREFS